MLPILPAPHRASEASDRVLHGQIPPQTIEMSAFADSSATKPVRSAQEATPVEPNPRSARSDPGQRFRLDELRFDVTLNNQLRDTVSRMERHDVFRDQD